MQDHQQGQHWLQIYTYSLPSFFGYQWLFHGPDKIFKMADKALQNIMTLRFHSMWTSNVIWWQRSGSALSRWWLVPWWHQAITWTRAHFLSLAQSKLRLCSANHRAGYFSNLACDWLSIVWGYSEQETENGPSLDLSIQLCGIHMRAISYAAFKTSICKMSFKITFLELLLHLPGANELIHDITGFWLEWSLALTTSFIDKNGSFLIIFDSQGLARYHIILS